MSAVPQLLQRPPGRVAPWPRAFGALLLCWAVLLWMYRQTADSMVQTWLRSDTFAHGLLVLPIALWLVWRRRQVLAQRLPQPAARYVALVLLVGGVWLLGELAAVNALAQGALVALLVLAVPALLGPAVARGMAFPLAFLFFAVPLGDFLLPQLMDWTANFTVFALRASGIPVLRSGNSFVIPSGSWSVVEACSGVRYLIASFMLGTLFAYLNFRSWYKRLVFVLASLLVPLLANWLRAYLIVLLGHISSNRLATGVDHLLYGWLFFGVVIGLLFVAGARWADPPAAAPPRRSGIRSVHAALAPTQGLWATTGALLLLAALPQLSLSALDRQAGAAQQGRAAAAMGLRPPELGPRWPLLSSAGGAAESTAAPLPALTPAYQQASGVWQAQYGEPGRAVGLYVALYRQQGRGRTLVGSGNVLLASNDAQWTLVERGSRALKLGRYTVTLRTSGLRAAARLEASEPAALQAWQLYWVRGHITASDLMAKVFSAVERLRGQRDDAAVLVAYAPSDAELASFWTDNYATLQAWLSQQETP